MGSIYFVAIRMHIVVGTGYRTQPFHPSEIALWDEEKIAHELMLKPKPIPSARRARSARGYETHDEHKAFRAVGRALATNLPIFTHTNKGKGALEYGCVGSAGVKWMRVDAML